LKETVMQDFRPNVATKNRTIRPAIGVEPGLGPLDRLPGTWANIRPEHRLARPDGTEDPFQGTGTLDGTGQSPFDGRGWNIIALPFAEAGQFRNYRLLMNQYNEVLRFTTVDDSVPNRGITLTRPSENADQLVAAIDYEQTISQISAADFAVSAQAGGPMLPIHHEPGFFLHMKEQTVEGYNIARLATIPHGNAANAIGRYSETESEIDGPPEIASISAFPEGVSDDIMGDVAAIDPNDPEAQRAYLLPYAHFERSPFKGVVGFDGFPGFAPGNVNALLQGGLPGNVKRTTVLQMDTDDMEAGIVNIPFIVRQADATVMRSTFWLMELDEMDARGNPRLVLAYSQFIYLDFFDRVDGKPGKIRWPHVSINMMEKIAEPGEAGGQFRTRAAPIS